MIFYLLCTIQTIKKEKQNKKRSPLFHPGESFAGG
jgi:hypothetical protein